ncbi:MAG: histidine kinase [Pseudonocardiaceae bacterium]|nr:histidine kinase [Pseudonocardiaceae bacterium]
MVGALAISVQRRLRWPVTAVGAVLTAAAGVVGAVVVDAPTAPVAQGLIAIIAVPMFAALNVFQIWFWEVTQRLDRARQAGADLAVTRERLRFAADLHDLQGHHLQVIALKGELVSRLIDADGAAARAQADELVTIARTALAETRDIVQGYRQADLHTEVSNAVRILAAAGIDAEVTGDTRAVPAAWQPLFGVLVREGTTNVLRHSQATRCALHLDADTVRVCNDGATEPSALDGGSGLAGLRERFTAAGGDVEAGATGDGGFRLVGRVP